MHPEIHIGNFMISSYMLMWILASISVPLTIMFKRKTYELSLKQTIILCVLTIVSGYLGCNALYVLENIKEIIEYGWRYSNVSFFGSIMISPIIIYLLSALFGVEKGKTFDLLAFGLPMFLAIVRIGCFLGGCCGGTFYDRNGIGHKIYTQLIEISFLIPIIIEFTIFEKKKLFNGYRFPIFLIEYGIIRFFIEFLRDTDKVIYGFSIAQVYSLVIFMIGSLIVLINLKKIIENNKKEIELRKESIVINERNELLKEEKRERKEKELLKSSKNPYNYSKNKKKKH